MVLSFSSCRRASQSRVCVWKPGEGITVMNGQQASSAINMFEAGCGYIPGQCVMLSKSNHDNLSAKTLQ